MLRFYDFDANCCYELQHQPQLQRNFKSGKLISLQNWLTSVWDWLIFQLKIWTCISSKKKMITKDLSVSGWEARTTENLTTCRRYDRDTQTSQTLQSSSWGTDTSDKSRSPEIWNPHQLTREDSLKFIRHD